MQGFWQSAKRVFDHFLRLVGALTLSTGFSWLLSVIVTFKAGWRAGLVVFIITMLILSVVVIVLIVRAFLAAVERGKQEFHRLQATAHQAAETVSGHIPHL